MSEERRITDAACWDATIVMAILYTVIYAFMTGGLIFVTVPTENADVVKILFGAMTLIQANIVQFYFGSTKSAENGQRLIAQSKERTDNVLREVVSAVTPNVPAQSKSEDMKPT